MVYPIYSSSSSSSQFSLFPYSLGILNLVQLLYHANSSKSCSKMSKICISNCVDDMARIPARASYVNLYKWPESDAEFVRSTADGGGTPLHSRVGESISCRKMYLRSYTFSRKAETIPERTMKCFVKVREKVVSRRKDNGYLRRWKTRKLQRWSDIFRRLLFCAAAVDVVDHGV